MNQVDQFHILAHLFISFIGAALLLAIWYNINKKFKRILEEEETHRRIDKGLVYLSMAVFVWVISGIWWFVGHLPNVGEQTLSIGINLLSTLNNLFLLLALFYFPHAPAFLYKNSKNVNKIIGAILLLAVVSVVLAWLAKGQTAFGMRISNIPDLLLSTFLSYLLWLSLYRTFIARELKVVAIIASLAILLMFISQLPEVFVNLGHLSDHFYDNLIKIIAKTSLIAVFLVLATSWVIQLANTPSPNEMAIKFLDWSLINISIPSKGIYQQHIDFGSKMTQYKNLLKFAIRRKYGSGGDQCLAVNAAGEIKNQSYLSRIIDNINAIQGLEESEKLERKDLFTFIGQGQYRLRINPNNIDIDEALLHEFCKDRENLPYQGFIPTL
ncbi:MAG: hypothetical protein AAF985_16310 [Bacteroidota bacterium]